MGQQLAPKLTTYRALYSFVARNADELSVDADCLIEVRSTHPRCNTQDIRLFKMYLICITQNIVAFDYQLVFVGPDLLAF